MNQKLRDHLAGLRVERGEQRPGAVEFVVVRAAFRLRRSNGCLQVECLHLRLLVDAAHSRVGRWIEIQTRDVSHFLDEEGSVRQLERLAPMRLQAKRVFQDASA